MVFFLLLPSFLLLRNSHGFWEMVAMEVTGDGKLKGKTRVLGH